MAEMSWVDDYERRARLIPGLWLIAPAVVLVLMFGLRSSPVISSLASLLVTAGGPVIVASYVRDRGLRREPALVEAWGGWPTTLLLTTGTPAVLAARRNDVERATGMTLPAHDQHQDDGYDAAIRKLRTLTSAKEEYPLVFAENRNYGFERNMLGVQPVAITVSVSALVVGVAAAVVVALHRHRFSIDLGLGLVLLAAIAGFWLWFPSRARTQTVAFKYAERLLDAASGIK